MPEDAIRTDVMTFQSDGTRCAGWVTYPRGEGPHPAVVLVHGLGATHQMMLRQYEQAFAGAGIATLAFDYRNTGASEGKPRQRIAMRRQHADVIGGDQVSAGGSAYRWLPGWGYGARVWERCTRCGSQPNGLISGLWWCSARSSTGQTRLCTRVSRRCCE